MFTKCCFFHQVYLHILMLADMGDDEWEAEKKSRQTTGDKQFSKWEKIATLGEHLSLVLDACLRPSASAKRETPE